MFCKLWSKLLPLNTSWLPQKVLQILTRFCHFTLISNFMIFPFSFVRYYDSFIKKWEVAMQVIYCHIVNWNFLSWLFYSWTLSPWLVLFATRNRADLCCTRRTFVLVHSSHAHLTRKSSFFRRGLNKLWVRWATFQVRNTDHT